MGKRKQFFSVEMNPFEWNSKCFKLHITWVVRDFYRFESEMQNANIVGGVIYI